MNNNKSADIREKYFEYVKSLTSSEYWPSDAKWIEDSILEMKDQVYISELLSGVPVEHERLIIVMAILHWLEEYYPEEYAILEGGIRNE